MNTVKIDVGNGWTLEWDTGDVETYASVSVSVEPIEVPAAGPWREYVAGPISLHIDATFKPGCRPRWTRTP